MKGSNVHIRPLADDDVEQLLRLELENRDFFEKYSPPRDPEYYTEAGQLKRILRYEEARQQDKGYDFGVFQVADDALVGNVSLFQVIRGSLQSAFIGYSLDQRHNGKGYTTEAVRLIVDYAFGELGLHRIEAGVMPHNIASMRVLEKAGFHKEGIARKNVLINGKWEDHQVLAILNPNEE